MTDTEKLQAIRARCVGLMEKFEQDYRRGLYPSRAAEAGWKSTIAAIDHIIPLHAMLCEGITQDFCEKQMTAIISAWEGQVS